jgi:PAS domain S-box-containing protein
MEKSYPYDKMRKKAEEILKRRDDLIDPDFFGDDIRAIIEELKVHQIELEQQNEELRRTQRQLELSHDKYEALYNFAPIGYFTLDDSMKILEINLTAAEMLGYHRAEIAGISLTKFVLPENQDQLYFHARSVLESNEKKYVELYVKNRHDKFIYVRMVSVLMKQGGNKFIRSAIIDISDKKEIEDTLFINEEKHRNLTESMSDFIYSLIIEREQFMHFDWVEGAYQNITGYREAELKKLPNAFISLIESDEIKEQYKKEIQKLVETKKSFVVEYGIKTKDGSTRWLKDYVKPILTAQGGINYILGAVQDITMHRKYEDNLKYHANLLNNVGDAIISTDKEFKIISWNRGAEKMYGWTPLEVAGRPIGEVLLGEFASPGKDSISETLGEKGTWKGEALHKNKTGNYLQVSSTVQFIYDLKGVPSGIVWVNHDITSLKKEQKIKSDLSAIVEGSYDAIFQLDLKGNIKSWNKAAEYIFDYDHNEILGKKASVLFRQNKDEIKMNLQKIKLGERIEHYQTASLKKNGDTINISISFSPLYDEFSDIAGASVIARDISDQKRLEEISKREAGVNKLMALIGKELLLPNLDFEKISDLVQQVAMEITNSTTCSVGRIEKENGTLKLLSFVEKGSDPLPILRVSPQGTDTFPGLPGKALNTRKGFYINTLEECLKFDEIPGWNMPTNNFLAVPAIINNTKVGVLSVSDAADGYDDYDLENMQRLSNLYALALFRMHTEIDLIKAKDKAEESDTLKSAFLSNMSHEIRTPMNAIIGFAELLSKPGIEEDRTKNYIDYIQSSGNSLLNLINDIIDISKIEAGQLSIEKTDVLINKLIYELEQIFSEELNIRQKYDVRILIQTQNTDPGFTIDTDPSRVKQIFINLIGNAIKFTENGVIKFGYTLKNQHEVQFFVKDTGIGIQKNKLESIFNRFEQVNHSHKKYGGTGLGLSICKHLVALLGGEIWVESEFGKGSTFYFSLPVTKMNFFKGENNRKKNNLPHVDVLKNKKILVVEDIDSNFELINATMKPYGVHVLRGMNSDEAMQMFHQHNDILLVLMDIQIPGKNGYELTKQFKKQKPNLPIIAQTAYAMQNEQKVIADAGFDDYLVKPIDISDLVEKMVAFLK